jgi:signal transduction histidine kinase
MNSLLLIDDEIPILETLGISLESEGYKVFTADSGIQGLKIFNREDIKLVITDIKMPMMDGIEVLRKIKESGRDAEVIVITGHGDMDSAIAALRYGASDFITKPIRNEALTLAIERAKQILTLRRKLKDYTENLEQKVEMRTKELQQAHEELLQSDRLATIGETISGLAHYIKNILNGLHGGIYKVDSAMKKDKPDLLKEGWDMVKRNIEKISDLTLSLLTYVKDRTPEREPCFPNEIIRDIIELLQDHANVNHIQLKSILDPELKMARLDKKSIHGAILNLVSNGIDACISDKDPTKIKAVTVKTSLQKIDGEKDKILIDVIDNGIGMSLDTQSKIFTRFFSTKIGKGTGLGLLISQKIIHEHGGEIKVESEEGRGSKFSVLLDLKAT